MVKKWGVNIGVTCDIMVQVYPPEIKGRDAVLRALKKAVEKENEAHPEATVHGEAGE